MTQAEVEWMQKLLVICKEIHEDYPELFTYNQEEVLLICEEILS